MEWRGVGGPCDMYRLCAGSEACHDQTTRLTLWHAGALEILPAMHRSLGKGQSRVCIADPASCLCAFALVLACMPFSPHVRPRFRATPNPCLRSMCVPRCLRFDVWRCILQKIRSLPQLLVQPSKENVARWMPLGECECLLLDDRAIRPRLGRPDAKDNQSNAQKTRFPKDSLRGPLPSGRGPGAEDLFGLQHQTTTKTNTIAFLPPREAP